MVKRIVRITLRVVLLLLVLFIIALLVFDRMVQFRMTDEEATTWFAKKQVPVRIGYYQSHGRSIRYMHTGADTGTTILFIHGAPSSATYYRDYLADEELLAHAHMIAVDRPGYGYSGLAQPVTSIQEQAAMIRPVLDSLQQLKHPVVVVGASYGTAIACRLAMDYPQLVDGLVLIAPALAPGEEKTYWFTPMIEGRLFHWAVPRMLQTANAEKIAHPKELQAMLPLWPNIRVPVNYLQGEKDDLVYTTNAHFARTHLVNAPYLDIQLLAGRGHLLVFLEKKRIRNSILDMLQRVKDK